MFIIFHYWKYFQQNTKGLLVSLISPIVLGKFILDTFWSEKIWTGFETENNVKIFELLSWALFCLVELYRCKTLRCLSLGIEKEQAIKCSEIFIKKKKKVFVVLFSFNNCIPFQLHAPSQSSYNSHSQLTLLYG